MTRAMLVAFANALNERSHRNLVAANAASSVEHGTAYLAAAVVETDIAAAISDVIDKLDADPT